MDVKVSNFSVLLIATASFVIVVAGMRAAATIVNPFLLSVFLAILFLGYHVGYKPTPQKRLP